jgi:hypothetical protein
VQNKVSQDSRPELVSAVPSGLNLEPPVLTQGLKPVLLTTTYARAKARGREVARCGETARILRQGEIFCSLMKRFGSSVSLLLL